MPKFIDIEKIKPIDFPSTEMDGLDVVRYLNTLPTVDAVEVVRCKDCEHWGGKYATNECSLITQLGNPDYWLKTAPDDFCSSGKRKEK